MSPLKYAYYPGCSGQGTSIEYEDTTRNCCKLLDVELVDVPDWSCCGSTPAHTVDHVLSSALSARNLAQVEDLGLDTVITPCPSCLTNLKVAHKKMGDKEFGDRVNKLLDKPCANAADAKSVLQILHEDIGPDAIKKKVVKPLKGLKVACYYGCIMNRPPEVMNFDDHENPVAMDEIMKACGADVVDMPLKVECCGASFGTARRDIVATLSGKLLEAAESVGAEAVVTACPLCQMNLDLRQGQINAANDAHYRMPVFYYTQLLGLALGLDRHDVGLDKLCVNPLPVLDKMESEKAAA